MPIGYPITVGLAVGATLLALCPARRPRWLGILRWVLSAFVNESPFHGLSLAGFVVGVPVLIGRSMQTRRVVDEAFGPRPDRPHDPNTQMALVLTG